MASILIVDDEPEIRFLTRIMLEKAGHSVIEAVDGDEGLRLLGDDKPDLILLDVMMHGLKGWEVCKKIKADRETRDTPVVMFTVRTSKEDKERSRKCGAEAHIDKPFDKKKLLNVVNGLLKNEKV